MVQSGNNETKIERMSNGYINDVLAVYEKLGAARSTNPKYSRNKPEENALTYEQMATTGLGGDYDLSYVYKLNNRVVGFVWGRLAYVGIPVQLVGFVHMIIVDPDFQRKGIASDLLDAVARQCAEKEVDTIRTVVGERDWDLSTFFHEAGFDNSGLLIYTRTIKS